MHMTAGKLAICAGLALGTLMTWPTALTAAPRMVLAEEFTSTS
jgi:hypothetical protein